MAGEPAPLAMRAAAELQLELEQGLAARAHLDRAGKMFGVLVVAGTGGRVGYLRAYSGMLAGAWRTAGFAPPVFDWEARQRFWPAGQRALDACERRLEAATAELPIDELAEQLQRLDAEFAQEMADLQTNHRERRQRRKARRASGCSPDERAALNAESQSDREHRQRRRREHEQTKEVLAAKLDAHTSAIHGLRSERATLSASLQRRIHDLYLLASPTGNRRPMRGLFGGDEPPGGAGDCAAPKLLHAANAAGLIPLALAEFWWGAAPAGGGRRSRQFYPPCRGKCGPLLGHLLDGIDLGPEPDAPGAGPGGRELDVVYEDDWLIAVNKPDGLLSVPGRGPRLRDSVLVRLRQRLPDATGPLLVHRLDLATSGLLLAAKTPTAHATVQRQFADRTIEKRYIAWVDGTPPGPAGTISLALRTDLDDRPRQIVDPVHGKQAHTDWRRLDHDGQRTRMELRPKTGRTHQLRVHASHPSGLDAPIVGDPLYGRRGPRLLLHAEALRLRHPRDGRVLELESPAPF